MRLPRSLSLATAVLGAGWLLMFLPGCVSVGPVDAFRPPVGALADNSWQIRRFEGLGERAMFSACGAAVRVRSYQSRAFDTTDTEKTLRAVVTTLQDLGFMIDQADATLGTVTGTKLSSHRVRATVSVRPHGTKQVLVRMNAQFSRIQLPDAARPLVDPGAYQDFFTALAKTLFLTGHEVG